MSFTRHQLKKLATSLDASRIQSREQDGKSLSYIEGWFVIAEANRIFGYDGWDRQTVHFERLFERRSADGLVCGYIARVAIKVRAQSTIIVREGTGFGQASAKRVGDAHELALKAAETDATKRALATFGGRFGLMLYGKEQHPRTAQPRCATQKGTASEPNAGEVRTSAESAPAAHATIDAPPQSAADPLTPSGAQDTRTSPVYRLTASDGTMTELRAPESFCSGLRQLIDAAVDRHELFRLRDNNQTAIEELRVLPKLMNLRGEHYADILERLFAQKSDDLVASRFVDDEQVVVRPPTKPVSPAVAEESDASVSAAIETAVALAVPAEASTLPTIYEPFLSVPPYPQAQLSERIVSATKRRADQAVAHEWDIPKVPRVTSQAPSAAELTDDQPSVILRTRRSQITGGFSIDKSALLVPSERRLRSKAHLQFVASKACVICESLPCHAHHITFAQPRGLSQKVSDEFTVPLCVAHHNALHAFGNEASWWRSQGIEPLGIASLLWQEG